MYKNGLIFYFIPFFLVLGMTGSSYYHVIQGQKTLMFLVLIVFFLLSPRAIFNGKYKKMSLLFALISIISTSLLLIMGDAEGLSVAFPYFLMEILGIAFIFFFLLLKDEYKVVIFKRFLTLYVVLLSLSIVEYWVVILTGKGIVLGIVDKSTNNASYNHYLFNLIKTVGISRFQSLTREPGDVGTLNGLLLIAAGNIKAFKKQFIILLIAGIMSLSLAFYVLLAFYLIQRIFNFHFKDIAILGVVGLLAFMFMQDTIGEAIIDRVASEEYDDRSSASFQLKFDSYIRSSDVFLGRGIGAVRKIQDFGEGSDGVKKELYERGILGLIIVFLVFSITYFKVTPISRLGLYFFIVFWICFYQRSNIFDPPISTTFFVTPLLLNIYRGNYEKI